MTTLAILVGVMVAGLFGGATWADAEMVRNQKREGL
jgi:hypothetical protein